MAGNDIPVNRDIFLSQMIVTLAGSLEDVIGLTETEGYITLVGSRLGDSLNAMYKENRGISRVPVDDVPAILADMKNQFGGNFTVESIDSDKIILSNTACPFGKKVFGRPSLCMMTSSVFGTITADANGYAKVSIDKALARGDPGCRIVIHLCRGDEEGREYFPDA
ncbi:methanogen output domain 1-containing protein [Meridianimarinicoccus aquatilis]|uniref:Transcriptional regulator n=1 Tax=Meridianimarinicoccus aquatilis TaxID=2552766 RepID=A0A4R6AJ45_9RHOB|nr:methanogen output domain 1-containing protein [Fluviibacterium aquatile]TDL81423.1 transcriptional regulator [Fluviibacterium aquatile]